MDLTFILKFLKDLGRHNDRDWFEKNKSRYLEAKQTFDDVVERVLSELVKFDPRLAGLNPKKLPFRIYRDVRFSKDKRPYKTNMGAGFSPNGRLIQEPGYYLHVEPQNKSFVAGGIYMPNAAFLAKLRQEIDYNPDGLKTIMKTNKFKEYFGAFDDFDKLKTAPKGYPKDHPHIEWLKLKSFILTMPLTDAQVTDKRFITTVASACKQIKPLNEYIRQALD